jgi:hypothetical protein
MDFARQIARQDQVALFSFRCRRSRLVERAGGKGPSRMGNLLGNSSWTIDEEGKHSRIKVTRIPNANQIPRPAGDVVFVPVFEAMSSCR